MKKLTTIVCSMCFMIAGVCLVLSKQTISTGNSLYAAELPQMVIPTHMDESALPLDLQLDLAKHIESPDTVFVETHDTIYVPFKKPKLKRRNSKGKKLLTEPDSVVTKSKDTLYVPALYIIVPLENLHESNDSLIVSE